jgi:cytochrome b6-f complex iron-sulfur subunit
MTVRRVSAFIDALLHNRRPPRFDPDADDVAAMRAAVELHAAQPGATIPSSEFVADLHRRLADEHRTDSAPVEDLNQRRISRRGVLQGAGAVAAAAAAGVLIDRELLQDDTTPRAIGGRLVPDNGTWQAVTTRAELTDTGVVPFTTPTTIGFVVSDAGRLAALSGVCTHQGCTLLHNPNTDRLDCPCHRASFDLHGDVVTHQFSTPLAPLPHLSVRERDGRIEIYAPTLE